MSDQKVAVVTGGVGGLGTAICRTLHDTGFRVATTFSPGNGHAQSWIDQQKSEGFDFVSYQVDVGDFSDWVSMFKKLMPDLGRVDVLVNNAGITRDQSLRKMSLDEWHMVLRTNLDSVFNMSKQVLEDMLQKKWGRIINISSVNGQRGAYG